MKLLNNFLLTLLCAATICSSSAMTPQQQEQVNWQLINSASTGDLSGVEQALAAGADIHADNDLALQWAAERGHLPVVQYLLELPEWQRADIHAENDAALRWAAKEDHLPVVQYLLEHGADIHAYNDLALQTAAIWDHWDVVVYLLRHGAERAVLFAYQLNLLYAYINVELQTALGRDDWHRVEELLSAVAVHELPLDIQQPIRAILVPAVQKKLNSACLVLPITPIALRTLSFIVGPKTAAAFSHLVKEDTHEIAQ